MFLDNEMCPCNSGLKVAECVCKSNSFIPVAAKTTPRLPITGNRVRGCYAADTQDCDGGLTREHPLSTAVLKVLSRGENAISVTNHPWQKEKLVPKRVGIKGLSKYSLCERHNHALSPLDTIAGRFVTALLDCTRHVVTASPGRFHRLFNGFDIERWMLKVLCGVQFDKRLQRHSWRDRWKPPLEWLSILFNGDAFPPGCGMYCRKKHQHRPIAGCSIYVQTRFATLYPTNSAQRTSFVPPTWKVVVGVEITLFDLELCLFMVPVPNLNEFSYRTSMHRFFNDDRRDRCAELHLHWAGMLPSLAGVVGRDELQICVSRPNETKN